MNAEHPSEYSYFKLIVEVVISIAALHVVFHVWSARLTLYNVVSIIAVSLYHALQHVILDPLYVTLYASIYSFTRSPLLTDSVGS